jgi:hypothetical protein
VETLAAIAHVDPVSTFPLAELQPDPLAAQAVVQGIEQQVLDQALKQRGVGPQIHPA